jgi:hypothetical protein
MRIAILTISDAGSRGELADTSGDAIASWAPIEGTRWPSARWCRTRPAGSRPRVGRLQLRDEEVLPLRGKRGGKFRHARESVGRRFGERPT